MLGKWRCGAAALGAGEGRVRHAARRPGIASARPAQPRGVAPPARAAGTSCAGNGLRPAAAAAAGLWLAGGAGAAGSVPAGAPHPGLENDPQDDQERGAQDRHVPQRGAGSAGRRGRPVPVQMQRWVEAFSTVWV